MGAWAIGIGALAIAVASILMVAYGGVPRLRTRHPDTEFSLSVEGVGMTPWIWIAAALTVPLWIWLARRFPLARGRWLAGGAVHAAVVLAVTHGASTAILSIDSGRLLLLPVIPRLLFTWSLPLWMVVAAVHVLEARNGQQAREAEATRLRAQLAESRLQILSAKLHPHFLFNTMQAISTLIHRDQNAADRMLGSLSDLLRECLARESRVDHSLAEELELLDRYMDICAGRIGDRLTYDRDVGEGALAARVPVFVLQPLAENAVEHGLARRAGPGRITVFARCDGGSLRFGIVDDGPGLNGEQAGHGLGLEITRERLHELYGEAGELVLGPAEPTGLRAEIRIPLSSNTTGKQAVP